MKKLLTYSLTLFVLFFLFFVINSKKVFASTEVYKVNDEFHTTNPTPYNYLYFQNYVTVPYKGGTVVISRDPDGTGDADVGDDFYLGDIAPNGFLFSYKAHSLDCRSHWQMPPQDITSFFKSQKNYVLYAQYRDACNSAKDISTLYIVQKNIPDPSPSPTSTPPPTPTPFPTNSPTPTPTDPVPFLTIPWNYESHGISKTDALLSINTYFDHSYPLLSRLKSLPEPTEYLNQITTFMNFKSSTLNYSSHDGYDYGRSAGAHIGDSVLAAAAGTATYSNSCTDCGNLILIDHHNGFQTRYMHLQKNGLITSTPGEPVEVTAGEEIGKVGATGRVIPDNELGAHIHFMVVEDKNHDGNFEDNIPDGVIDPFGWQSSDIDPWAVYSFVQNDQSKIGTASYNIWKDKVDSTKQLLHPGGGTIQMSKFTLVFPIQSVSEDTQVELTSAPKVDLKTKASLGATLVATAKTMTGIAITQFQKAFTLTVNFATYDLSPFDLDTLSLYSSQDGITWQPESTVIDVVNKKATAEVNHFTQFALMADKKDLNPPTTLAQMNGREGEKNWFSSDVEITLSASDGDGTGVDYTEYKVDDEDWDQYTAPLDILKSGKHTLDFYSVDTSENIEPVRHLEFIIDKTVPEAKISFNQKNATIDVTPVDSLQDETIHISNIGNHLKEYTISTKAGNTTSVDLYTFSFLKKVSVGMVTKIRYNSDPPYKPYALFGVISHSNKNTYSVFEQFFRERNQNKVKLSYQPKKNSTSVSIWEKNKEKIEEIVSGIHILTLITAKGELVFSY